MPYLATDVLSPYERLLSRHLEGHLARAAESAAAQVPVLPEPICEPAPEPAREEERELASPIAAAAAAVAAAIALGPSATKSERLLNGQTLNAAAEETLDAIVAIEAAKNRLEADLLDHYAALHTVATQQYAGRAGVTARGHGSKRLVSIDQIVAKEVALATGVGESEVARRLRFSLQPRRHRVLRARMREGATSLHRALHLADFTKDLDDDLLPDLEESVLAPLRDWMRQGPEHTGGDDSADGATDGEDDGADGATDGEDERDPAEESPLDGVCSQPTFRQRVRRKTMAADPAGHDKRHATRVKGRRAYGQLTEDGMGYLSVTGSAERIVACLERMETVARAHRAAGDPRTLDQLRSDFITDAILFGWPSPGATDVAPSATDPTEQPTDPSTSGAAAGDPDSPDVAPSATHPTTGLKPTRWMGAAPTASVWIVVPFEVANGTSDAPVEIPGHGWVTAQHARAIITAEGSVWRWLGVDSVTGRALELSTDKYRPTAAMVEHVRAVDGLCRGPGCTVPASRCDLDHVVNWPEGPTDVTNLVDAHRGHHQPKTAGAWTSSLDDDGTLTWQTLTGRSYTSHAKDWLESQREQPHPAHDGGAPPAPAPDTDTDPTTDPAADPTTDHDGDLPPF